MTSISKIKATSIGYSRAWEATPMLSIVSIILAFLGTSSAAIAEEPADIGQLPHALICSNGGVTVVGYLTRVNGDGVSVYMTLSGITVTVSPEGKVAERSSSSCSGKSLDELRDLGQTREFAK